MAAPKVAATETSEGTATTSMGVLLPTATYTTGDTVLAVLGCQSTASITPPAGWVLVDFYDDTAGRVSVFKHESNGTESGATVTFIAATAEPYAAVALLVTGGEYDDIEASAGADSSGTAITFGAALAPSWGLADTLWMAVAVWIDDDEPVTAYPALYLESQDSTVSGGGVNAGAGVLAATRRYRAASDIAGGATLNASEGWAAFMVAVRPAVPDPPDVPTGPAGLMAQIQLEDGVWTDIGEAGVYVRDTVQIRQGRSDWAGRADPSTCTLTLDNRTGEWSPDYDAALGLRRNIPLRVGADGVTGGDNTTGQNADIVFSAAIGADSLASDLDLRVEFQLGQQLANGVYKALVGHIDGSSNGWALRLTEGSGLPVFTLYWYDNSGTFRASTSEQAGPMPEALWWDLAAVRVTLDESTGDVEWFYGTTIAADDWTSVGTTNPYGPTTLDHAAYFVRVGIDLYGSGWWPGRIHAVQLLDGIDGTPVFDLDLKTATPGATGVTDTSGRSWTVGTNGDIRAIAWRFCGEIASLPVSWDLSGNDQWVRVQAAGTLRRLRQWGDLLQSPLRRALIRGAITTNLVAYWPMEEAGDGNLAAYGPAVGDKLLARYDGGDANPADNTDFVASAPIPTFDTDRWLAAVPAMPQNGEWMVRWLMSVPADHSTTSRVIEVVTGDLSYGVFVDSSGNVQVIARRNGVVTHTGSNYAFNAKGTPYRMGLAITQDGADVDVSITGQPPGGVTGGGGDTFSTAQATVPQFLWVNLTADMDGIAVGHITVESEARAGGFDDELAGYEGETAVDRIERLCSEEGVAVTVRGDDGGSVQLGPQPVASFMTLLDQAADTDLGALYDKVDGLGLEYRTGASIRNQAARFQVDYDQGDALGTPQLERDDNGFANDVIVTNWDGQQARAELTAGPQSTSEPPVGAGRSAQTYDVSVAASAGLLDHAQARLQLHSVDLPRLTGLVLATHHGVGDADIAQVLALRPGDKLGVAGLPATAISGTLDQIVQGWTERIGTHTHELTVNTTPSAPWDPGIVEGDGDLEARYDTAGSFLANGADAGATSLVVATSLGPVWTTDGGELPFDVDIDGARVTVTAISGTGAVQTFTVAATPRYLHGGASVALADPAYYTL